MLRCLSIDLPGFRLYWSGNYLSGLRGYKMRLEAENLAGERGGETILAGLSFALSEGEALAVTGPNGSGKSTLLRIICGLLLPEAGKVELRENGTVLPVRAACHYLGHQNAMKPALSVRENLSFWQKFNGAA